MVSRTTNSVTAAPQRTISLRYKPSKVFTSQLTWTDANNCPTRCNYIQFIYICKPLYMFRVVSPPIVRSSYHCIHSTSCRELDWPRPVTFTTRDAVNTVTWAPDDGWRYYTKHVERSPDINNCICTKTLINMGQAQLSYCIRGLTYIN